MAELIDITLNARVKNGPTMAFSISLEVDAYVKLDVTVKANANETIQVLPIATSAVKLLFVQSSQYSSDISYKVNGGANSIVLDRPQSFIGEGAISVLDAAVPSTLEFTNSLAEDVKIQILVGRSAI